MNLHLHIQSVSLDVSQPVIKLLTKILQLGESMNAALQAHLDKQNAHNARILAGVAALATSLTGVTGDVKTLNDKITALQNSAGTITPEDQALLDAADTAGSTAADKLDAAVAALKALDDLTADAPVAGDDVTEVVKP